MISICLAYLIFTFREFKSIHKGKTAILHLCFGTEKNRRLGSKKARYIRAFRVRHLFCLHIMVEVTRFELATSASRTQRSTKLSHTSILSLFSRGKSIQLIFYAVSAAVLLHSVKVLLAFDNTVLNGTDYVIDINNRVNLYAEILVCRLYCA